MYSKEPSKDCNCLLVLVDLEFQCVHTLLFCNVSAGMEIVLLMVFTTIPKQVTSVCGDTSLLRLTCKPRSCKKDNKN